MLDIAAARIRVDGSNVVARDFVDLLQHRIDGDAVAACDVERLPGRSRRLARQKVGLDDVPDECEIARLQTVAVNRGTPALQHRGNEQSKDAAVLRCRILPWPEDIEVAQRHGLQTVSLRKDLAVHLAEKLLR